MTHAPRKLAYVLGLCLVAFGAWRCNSEGEIQGFGGSDGGFSLDQRKKSTTKKDTKKKKKTVRGGSLDIDVSEDEGNSGDAQSEETAGDEPAPAPIEYPVLEFKANGVTTCDGNNYNTTAAIVTSVNDSEFIINMVAARVHCGGRCQEQADKEIQSSIGVTRYERTTKAQRKAAEKAGGFVDAPFAIFANGVVKQKTGQAYAFDKPLPVFPWPGAKGTYAGLDAGPMRWQANVTGFRNFTAIVEVKKAGEQGDDMLVHFTTTIVQDQARILYEDFPLPREALYTVNMRTRDVRQINAINWFNGEKCDNNPEQVALIYKVCKKIKGGVPEQIPCG